MKKLALFLGTTLMSFTLIGCNGNTNSSTSISTTSGTSMVTVKFDYNGGVKGENDPTEIQIEKGSYVTNIPEPTKEYCIFEGWWNGETQLTPTLQIKKNTTFIASWEEHYPTYDGNLIFLTPDEHVTITVYQNKACNRVDEGPHFQTRDKVTGEYSKVDADFYFSLDFDQGYELDSMNFRPSDGAWSGEILNPSQTKVDTNKDNCYRMTSVNSNGELTVTSKAK